MKNKIINYEEKISILEQENQLLKSLVDFYKSQSTTDALTQIGNRRLFDLDSIKYMEISERNNLKLFLILIDVDDFKLINDTYGHHRGDEALQNISKAISDNIRGEDGCYRIGGDEFAILALDTSTVSLAKELCKRIRNQCNISLSIGVVECTNLDIESSKKTADSLLYLAKESGKNCTCFFDNKDVKVLN